MCNTRNVSPETRRALESLAVAARSQFRSGRSDEEIEREGLKTRAKINRVRSKVMGRKRLSTVTIKEPPQGRADTDETKGAE